MSISPVVSSASFGEAFSPLGMYASPADPSGSVVIESRYRTELRHVAFIDTTLTDYKILSDGLTPGTAVYLLKPEQDAISQMSRAIASHRNLASVQIFSHGDTGTLQLGHQRVDTDALTGLTAALQAWANALDENADILLYGCNVAAGDVGQAFVNRLADLTGADVAASTDLTGSRALGGDWDLEFQTGSIESLTNWQQPAYQAVLAAFTVTSAADAGAGTLRQAILDANSNPGADTINFNIGTGIQTINLLSALPSITDVITIDGYSQTGSSENTLAVGSNAVLNIVLNGSGGAGKGLTLANGSAGSTVQGLVLQGFLETGLAIFSDGNTIRGNFVGTDATGNIAVANAFDGIQIFSDNNLIGGTSPGDRNLISGNARNGVLVWDAAANNQVQGNYIGTNAAGNADLGNTAAGIWIQNTGSINNQIGGNTPGAGNLISGNNSDGIILLQGTTGTQIQGNKIGTNAAGTSGLGNGGDGIYVQLSPTETALIGGTAPEDANTIAFNAFSGVALNGGTSSILGNSIFSNDGAGIFNVSNPSRPVINRVSDGAIAGFLSSTANTDFRIEFFANADGENEGEIFLGSTVITTDGSGLANFNFGFTFDPAYPDITATATNLTTGNTSAFSSINASPTLSGNATLAAIDEDTSNPGGETINNLFSSLYNDANSDSFTGIVVVGNTANAGTEGTWQYSTDGGTTWLNIGSVNTTNALALSVATQLRFLPVSDFSGTPTGLILHAVDATYSSGFTTGTTRVIVDASANGGQNAISGVSRTLNTSVTPVNDAPVVDNPLTNQSSFEDTAWNYTIPTNIFSDVDDATLTLSATLSDDTSLPEWLSFDAATGTFSGTPPRDFNGIVFLKVMATDGDGESTFSTFELEIIKDPEIAIGDISVDEQTGEATFTVMLDAASTREVSVDFTTADGTAEADKDYTAIAGTLVFAPGETQKTITVNLLDDNVSEMAETFSINLSNVVNGNLAIAEATGTIVDDDPVPTIRIKRAILREGHKGTRPAKFFATLSNPSDRPVSFDYSAFDGRARRQRRDYEPAAGTLIFNPGETESVITVQVRGDKVYERREACTIVPSNAVNANLATRKRRGIILNDDPMPVVGINDVVLREGNRKNKATFVLTLAGETETRSIVRYRTLNGTATVKDQDYGSKDGLVVFEPGQTEAKVSIDVFGDRQIEKDEVFEVEISPVRHARVGKSRGTATLRNDDR